VDHIKIFRELYRKELYLDEFLAVAQGWREEFKIRKFFCDPAEPGFIVRMQMISLQEPDPGTQKLPGARAGSR